MFVLDTPMYSGEDMIACDAHSIFWNMHYQRVHTSEITALSRIWKKTPIGIRMCVSKVCVICVVLQQSEG